MGLALAAVYFVGASAPHAEVREHGVVAETDVSFSEAALQRDIRAMSPGARAIAERYDPQIAANSAMRDREAEAFAARLTETDAAPSAPTMASLILRPALGVSDFDASSRFDPTVIDALDSARDLECLTQAVYYEARGESPQGQAAVAQVVLNRVRHPAFPKTVCGVVFQGASAGRGCQFSFACDGSMGDRREPGAWREAETVASRALSGAVMAQVGRATHFHTTDVAAAWSQDMIRVAQVGMHVFYRFGHVSPAVIQASADGVQTPPAATDEQPPVLAKAATADAPHDEAKAAGDAKPATAPVAAVQPASAQVSVRTSPPTA